MGSCDISNKKPKEVKKKTRLQIANKVILILNLVFPVWAFALMYTPSISFILFLIAWGTLLLNAIIYKLVTKFNKGQTFLHIIRGIVIISWIAFYTPMTLMMNFSHTKPLYSLKRADYIHGVYGNNSEFYGQLLPEKLPEICDDYSFIAQGSMVAQDYHASSYLMFHTDTATLDSYALRLDQFGGSRLENESENESVQEQIEWFCGQMRLRDSFNDNLDNAVVYWFDGRYPKAVLLNYETGLVAVLT